MKDILKVEVDIEFLKFYVQYHIKKSLKYVNHLYETDSGHPLQGYARGQLTALVELRSFLEMPSSVNYITLQEKYQDSLTFSSEDT